MFLPGLHFLDTNSSRKFRNQFRGSEKSSFSCSTKYIGDVRYRISIQNSESLNMEEPLSIHLKTKQNGFQFFPKISEAKCSIFDNICRKTLNKINDCPNKTIKPTKTTVLIRKNIWIKKMFTTANPIRRSMFLRFCLHWGVWDPKSFRHKNSNYSKLKNVGYANSGYSLHNVFVPVKSKLLGKDL